jgi:putative CocE/NonD family hydrolase
LSEEIFKHRLKPARAFQKSHFVGIESDVILRRYAPQNDIVDGLLRIPALCFWQLLDGRRSGVYYPCSTKQLDSRQSACQQPHPQHSSKPYYRICTRFLSILSQSPASNESANRQPTYKKKPGGEGKVTERYEGSAQEYGVECLSNVMIPMRDGVSMATDLYFPAHNGKRAEGRFPIILERTPYDKAAARNAANGAYFARRGYVCAIQDVRGRFASEGEWYPFALEAPDGYDTVEWLAAQPWANGKVGTMGGSYCGSDQSALATLNPPHLSTMIVAVGASNYYHASMRQNGALELRFFIYAMRMATTSKEALANPALRAALTELYAQAGQWLTRTPYKAGSSALRLLPTYEQWVMDILTHGNYDDYWRQRGYAISEYYEEHADVPTLYLGGWYDSYARATCENYIALSKRKQSRQVLLMGPWTHGGWEVTHAGDLDFGTHSQINYNDLRLAWFDHFLKGMQTEVADWSPVKIFVMGSGSGRRTYDGRIDHGGRWRDAEDYPLPETQFTPYYLHVGGALSPSTPEAKAEPSRYTFDPRSPVPTIGGGISAADPIMQPGGYDQRGRLELFGIRDTLPLNARNDVLSFQTAPLDRDVEISGPLTIRLFAASSALDTDFTAKLIDLHPPSVDYPSGLAINISDSILRARYRNGWDKPALLTPGEIYEFEFQLYPTSNIFRAGHSIRLDISSSNFPRFDVNPNTGGPLGQERRLELAHQTIYHDSEHPSHIVLPLIPR